MVDPLKVKVIIQLASPHTINRHQSLQGKAKFFHRFIVNYAEIKKGFMCLLNKGVPFVWDEQAQQYFDIFKKASMSIPLLIPLEYNRDFFLYPATYESTICMVLVEEDNVQKEHVIYYLSKGIFGPELKHIDQSNILKERIDLSSLNLYNSIGRGKPCTCILIMEKNVISQQILP
jgi:hypothetical protein